MAPKDPLEQERELQGQIWEHARLADFRGALRARQAADEFRARSRGYQTSPMFGVSLAGAEPTLVVPLDLDAASREWLHRLLLLTDAAGLSIDDFGKRVGAVVLFRSTIWPEFSQWQTEFRRVRAAPAMWDDCLLDPQPGMTNDEREFERLVNPLSFEARFIATRARALVPLSPAYGLSRAGVERGFQELESAGCAHFPAPPAVALQAVGSKELAAACRAAKLPVSGPKSELIARLLAQPEVEIARLLPDSAYASLELPKLSEAWAWSTAFHELLAHTIVMTAARARDLANYANVPVRGVRIVGDSECSICRDYDNRVVPRAKMTRQTLPPFHPGCRCASAPET